MTKYTLKINSKYDKRNNCIKNAYAIFKQLCSWMFLIMYPKEQK